MLNITTDSGVRLDLNPKATIEVNMGGISLLDLSSRTATYTNSFKLPRTPNNELIFAFASQPTRNNRPVINVTITKGLFQRKAVLKVLEFGDSYKCSVSYSNIIDTIKNTKIDFITPQLNIKSSASLEEIGDYITVLSTNSTFHCLYTNSNSLEGGNVVISVKKWLELLSTHLGITISGTLLVDSDFLNMQLLMPDYSHEIVFTGGNYVLNQLKIGNSIVNCSNVFKAINEIFMCDIIYNYDSIEFNLVNVTKTPLITEGFMLNSKKMSSDYAKENYIKYTNEGDNDFFGSDYFIADGIGEKEVFKINSIIPKTDIIGYITTKSDDFIGKVILFTKGDLINEDMTLTGYSITVDIFKAAILTLSGFYSNILNPIFANPVILEAERYIDPLTADNIMTNRIINSVQLGGRYWVDSMAYNLTTGQSKMTLIKLP